MRALGNTSLSIAVVMNELGFGNAQADQLQEEAHDQEKKRKQAEEANEELVEAISSLQSKVKQLEQEAEKQQRALKEQEEGAQQEITKLKAAKASVEDQLRCDDLCPFNVLSLHNIPRLFHASFRATHAVPQTCPGSC